MPNKKILGKALGLAALAAVVLTVVALPAMRWWLRVGESSPILRGRLLAEQVGCLACHGQSSRPEIPNPGSRWQTVPRFGVGNAMMYEPNRQGIEEFIRFGAPRAWLDDDKIRLRLATQRVRMPAYEDRLSDRQIGDLAAYVAAVERVEEPGDAAAAAGRQLAREHGCVDCHGLAGAGGEANPGSLGGFVPGFAGRNFAHLVDGEAEFREWIRTGTNARLGRNPLVRYFWRRQALSMPAYGADLDDQQLDQLWAWVETLRQDSAD